MSARTYRAIAEHIETLPVVSSHEHHLEDADQNALTLERILQCSYVDWQGISVGESDSDHDRFLDQARHNSYYVWLEKALDRIYRIGGKLTARNWRNLSAGISHTHSDPEAHLRILREHCRYRYALADVYWNTGSDLGHPDLFKPVVRTDMFVAGFHPSVEDHDGNSPWRFLHLDGLTFDGYVELLNEFLRNSVKNGAVAFKLAAAYERTLALGTGSYDRAARIFMKPPADTTEEERLVYGDYIFRVTCGIASELGIPYQVHTGLGRLQGSNPLLLEPVIERYPDIVFVLFHGGYPWIHETGALAHNHPNVHLDMVWLPLISTSAALQALHEYIEVVPSSDRIAWGGDCWTSEESLGALLAYQHVVASVLAEKVDGSYFDLAEARLLAEKLLYRNAQNLYS
ncbi:MAG: amidohydrolase family protein [Spirochaetales bacterium]|nr:amidohydrolase family protein [Spirochaetales bacterium]